MGHDYNITPVSDRAFWVKHSTVHHPYHMIAECRMHMLYEERRLWLPVDYVEGCGEQINARRACYRIQNVDEKCE